MSGLVQSARAGFDYPADWRTSTIDASVAFISGKAHEPFVSPRGKYVVVNSKFISTDGVVRKFATKNITPARRGDVLMVMSDLPNGRALAKCFLVDADSTYAVNQRVCIFRTRKDDPRFLRFLLNRNPYFMAFDDGVQQTHLLNETIRKCPLVLPPVEEQRAIGDALTDVEAHIRSLERLITKKKAIKQGMMQQLLTGRTRLPGFNGQWREARIGELASVDPEALPSGTQPGMRMNYISLEDVSRGELLGSSKLTFGSAPSRARRVVKSGDVLFGTVRPNLQSHVHYLGGLDNPIASTGFAVIRGADGADPAFVFNLVMSDMASAQLDRIIAGSNYPAVSSADVRKLAFEIPDLREQRAIAEALTDAQHEVVALGGCLTKARAIKTGMLQQLLTGRVRFPTEAAS